MFDDTNIASSSFARWLMNEGKGMEDYSESAIYNLDS